MAQESVAQRVVDCDDAAIDPGQHHLLHTTRGAHIYHRSHASLLIYRVAGESSIESLYSVSAASAQQVLFSFSFFLSIIVTLLLIICCSFLESICQVSCCLIPDCLI